MKKPPRWLRKVQLFGAIAVALVAILLFAWISVPINSGSTVLAQAGSSDNPNRVDVSATIIRVDPAGGELTLRLVVNPRGALLDQNTSTPTGDLHIYTSQDVRSDISLPAGKRISSVDVQVAITGTDVTSYPFDNYQSTMEFYAYDGTTQIPLNLTLASRDTMFSIDADGQKTGQGAVLDLDINRQGGILGFAIFMICAMWVLCGSVIAGTYFIITRKRGLVWPALGWMAASLFALAGFRNAAPGSPPIGSLIDYLAFFWAEAAVMVCILIVVINGIRTEPAPIAAVEHEPDPEPEPKAEPTVAEVDPAPRGSGDATPPVGRSLDLGETGLG